MELIKPDWKVCKNGAQQWCWFFDGTPAGSSDMVGGWKHRVLALTFFKTTNKITLRVKLSSAQGVRSVNLITFYLRKGRTLEIFSKKIPHGAANTGAVTDAAFDMKKKWRNRSNDPGTAIAEISTFILNHISHAKSSELFGQGSFMKANAKKAFFHKYFAGAIKSIFDEAGILFEISEGYRHDLALPGTLMEIRAPIIKTMRQDWTKQLLARLAIDKYNIPLDTITEIGVRENKTTVLRVMPKEQADALQPYVYFTVPKITSLLMNHLIKCKDIKDVCQRFFGNKGKNITKPVAEHFFSSYRAFGNDEEKERFLRSGELRGMINREHAQHLFFQSTLNIDFLTSGLFMKKILTVDHVQKLMPAYGVSMWGKKNLEIQGESGFGDAWRLFASTVRRSLEGDGMLHFPRSVAYAFTVDQNRTAYIDYAKELIGSGKKFRMNQEVAIEKIADWMKQIGDSKKIFHMVTKDRLGPETIWDGFKQWYIANGKVDLPKSNCFVEIHDDISREYARLMTRDFELKLNEIPWVKEIDGLQFSDLKTKRQFRIQAPRTNHDLVVWGQKLDNCIGGYGSNVKQNYPNEVLLAIYVDGTLTYNLEITRMHLRQFYTNNNRNANTDDEMTCMKVLVLAGVQDKARYTLNAHRDDVQDAIRYAVAIPREQLQANAGPLFINLPAARANPNVNFDIINGNGLELNLWNEE